jgi:hypothetical protein
MNAKNANARVLPPDLRRKAQMKRKQLAKSKPGFHRKGRKGREG